MRAARRAASRCVANATASGAIGDDDDDNDDDADAADADADSAEVEACEFSRACCDGTGGGRPSSLARTAAARASASVGDTCAPAHAASDHTEKKSKEGPNDADVDGQIESNH
jgi:hypothetical protein